MDLSGRFVYFFSASLHGGGILPVVDKRGGGTFEVTSAKCDLGDKAPGCF